MTRARRSLAAALLACALAPALAAQQPQRSSPDAQRLREALRQRLEQTRAQESDLIALLTRLDEGESLEEVLPDARPLLRDDDRTPGRERAPRRAGDDDRDSDRADDPDAVDDTLDLLGEVDPPMRDRLRRLAQENPERARAVLRRAQPRLRELAELKRDDPEAFRLRLAMMGAGRDAYRAAQGYARAERDGAGEEELARRREEVAAAVRARLELEHRLKAQEIERLAQRVEELRAQMSEQSSRLDQLVREQTDRLIERVGSRRPDHRGR